MFFPQKLTDFYILRMDKFHFPGPVCVFLHVNVGKPPLQFVAGFSLSLFLTTNPRWWFQIFFYVHPQQTGGNDEPNWTCAYFSDGLVQKTHQPANNKSSCLELSPGEKTGPSAAINHLAEPEKVRSQSPAESRRIVKGRRSRQPKTDQNPNDSY